MQNGDYVEATFRGYLHRNGYGNLTLRTDDGTLIANMVYAESGTTLRPSVKNGDIWQPQIHMLPVVFSDGKFVFPVGMGASFHKGDGSMTEEQFFKTFPEAKLLMRFKQLTTGVSTGIYEVP